MSSTSGRFLSLSFRRMCPRRVLSHSSSSVAVNKSTDSSIDKNDTFMEQEKELFKLKRDMAGHYSTGNYHDALVKAIELEVKSGKLLGKRNVVYASCLNNVALMHKNLGKHEQAVNSYNQALHLYEEIVGKANPSFAATLTNIGALYKSMAVAAKGVEKHELLCRAEEALSDALAIRTTVLGANHKETITTTLHLSSVFTLRGQVNDVKKAEEMLRSALHTTQSVHQATDLLNATIMNNLGVLLKGKGSISNSSMNNSDNNNFYVESREMYEKALDIRQRVLGDHHNDCLVTMHNLAELYTATGDTVSAKIIQERILKLFERFPEGVHVVDSENNKDGGEVTETASSNITNNCNHSSNSNNPNKISNHSSNNVNTFATRPPRHANYKKTNASPASYPFTASGTLHTDAGSGAGTRAGNIPPQSMARGNDACSSSSIINSSNGDDDDVSDFGNDTTIGNQVLSIPSSSSSIASNSTKFDPS